MAVNKSYMILLEAIILLLLLMLLWIYLSLLITLYLVVVNKCSCMILLNGTIEILWWDGWVLESHFREAVLC